MAQVGAAAEHNLPSPARRPICRQTHPGETMAEIKTKPYIKLAGTLASIGVGLFFIERFGLAELSHNGTMHIDGTILSLMVIVPIALVLAGAVVFMVGKMRRL
jgi:hypothetical protein